VHDMLFLSTYPPRRCGVATFTHELIRAVEQQIPGVGGQVVAVHNAAVEPCSYPSRVIAQLDQQDRPAYRNAAAFINAHSARVLGVQHEFGIFGGAYGAWLLDLLQDVKKPVALTMHSVLQWPTFDHRRLVRDLCERASKIVVLSQTARRLLETHYFIASDYIEVIPHGVPDVLFVSTSAAKAALGLQGRFVVSTFGLLSRGMDIECAIDAIAAVAKQFPNVLYLIIGTTHPNQRSAEGERYRSELQNRIVQARLSRSVVMLNRYYEMGELLQYLLASDAYVTPYANESQVVSAALAYALAAGKPVISTPYLYACEALRDRRGLLVPFNDSPAMARALTTLIENPTEREILAQRAYAYARGMVWSEAGRRYARLLHSLESGSRAVLA
jgi:glycosyltransferase involved in cell wall biosynthesis